jgi:ABC-type uncharacterized transport system substrate-binding protein
MPGMRRRDFVALLGGGAAAAWPLSARGQQMGKRPIIGFLGANTPSAQSQWTAAFVQRLRDLGWIEGRSVTIEYRWADGRPERAAEIAAEFVRLGVDVIVTQATTLVTAAKQATSTIPIVFATAADPVGTGLVASLARPGGNVTGISTQTKDLVGKRLELLREILPDVRQLAVLAHIGSAGALLEMDEVQDAAKKLGFDVVQLAVRRGEDFAPALGALSNVGALYVCSDPLIFAYRTQINTFAAAARVPTAHLYREYVEAGGLISYGPNFPALFQRAAEYVDKILRGTKPTDIPVEQPTKFDLIINLSTAKALGIDFPSSVLARADEVIE